MVRFWVVGLKNMKTGCFDYRFRHSNVFRCTIVMLVALAWTSLSFCGEIHDAAKDGDLEKVKALLQSNPDLVFSKDDKYGATPLHWAAAAGLTNRFFTDYSG